MDEVMCLSCGRMPCHVHSMGQEYLDYGYAYRNATGNNHKTIRYKLYSRYIREVYGVLGRGVRVKLPECFEKFIKESFPNEDGSNYMGFREAVEHNDN